MGRKSAIPCNMDCFNCVHDDCINDVIMSTKQEYYYLNRDRIREREKEAYRAKKALRGVVMNTTGKKTADRTEYNKQYYQQNRAELLARSNDNYKKRKKQKEV